MPNPTKSEILTQWGNTVKILDETRKYGNVNATNFVGLLDTLRQSYEGDFLRDSETAVSSARSLLAGIVSQRTAQDLQRPFLRQFVKSVIGRKDAIRSSDTELLAEMYDYFVDTANNDRVQSRVFTFGSPSANAANIGNTQIIRLNKDAYNFDIENQHIDSKKATCIVDHNTGADKGNETWLFEGQTPGVDALEVSGSGAESTLFGLTVDQSLVSNAGFQSFSGSAASPTAITDWSSSGGDSSSIYVFDSTNVFRAGPSDGDTSYSLQLKATTNLTQKLSAIGRSLSRSTPYLLAVVWNRDIGAGDGTLVLRMGNVSTSVTVSAQTGWVVTVCPAVQDWAHWYRVFAEDDVQIDVDWTRTSGDLRIAEVLLVPGEFHDGSHYWVLPASAATWNAPRVDDEFTWSDIATDSIIQRWLWRAWGVYMPHSNGSSITWSEP